MIKPRVVLLAFIGLCAATVLALTFLARSLTRSSGDSIPTITQRSPLVEKRTTLPSGEEVRESYEFGRTALKAMAVGPECFLALTDSGNVLRYEQQDLRLTLERVPLSAAVAIVHVPEKGFFVGCADGCVLRIDPLDLKLTQVGRLNGQPSWMGSYLDGRRNEQIPLVAVQAHGGAEKPATLTLYRFNTDPPASTTHELPRTIRMGLATAFFVDGRNHLWLGGDEGEWGGLCARLDLSSGQMTALGKYGGHTSEGVYGFVGLPDGQVWAHGGMMHLGVSRAFIARVDRGKFEEFEGVFQEDSQWAPRFPDPDEKKKAPYNGPKYPITHIIPDPGGEGLLVFAYTDLFRTDFALKNWTSLCQMKLQYTWGRPDALGSYPAIKSVQPLGGDSKDLLCVTGLDGLLRISGGKVTRYVVGD
jgi:hypothetical protein